jgi:sugar/nucleoside kinase (ribokinase family)
MAADATGERARAGGVGVDVVSTLGAGDVFHGALVAAHVRGLTLARALEYANTVAALSCRGLDGRSAIPTHDVVDAHLRARTA